MAIQMNSFVGTLTISSCSALLITPGNGTNFYGRKLQTTHFHKGSPLQHYMRSEKMIAITARSRNISPYFTFPKFSNGHIQLYDKYSELQEYGTLLYKSLDTGYGHEFPKNNQRVVVICTIYNEKQEVKGIEDEKITLVMGDKTNELGKGFDKALRQMRVNGRAIFIIHKNLWPSGRRMPKTSFGSSQKYIVCDVTLLKILG
ncbi:uncharacterized protein LOC115721038 [Cannabis sativa]|uniref:uncharacterized protein LOC115721038 n=1 Tax=Cannabis sativa TaxID=3483 RepID=UPI0029C9CE0A|nr:uncharacterized protein LOC115721038 [Cannabis sativa]